MPHAVAAVLQELCPYADDGAMRWLLEMEVRQLSSGPPRPPAALTPAPAASGGPAPASAASSSSSSSSCQSEALTPLPSLAPPQSAPAPAAAEAAGADGDAGALRPVPRALGADLTDQKDRRGKNEIYKRESLVGPFLAHKRLGR